MEQLAAATSIPDWSNVTDDVLRYIADITHSFKDRVCMTAVCRAWHASLKGKKLKFPACLMLRDAENSGKRCFYSMTEEIFVELDLPEIRGRRCWGSRFGWLVTSGIDLQIQLFNPLSRASHSLPSIHTLPRYEEAEEWSPEKLCKSFLIKLILSSGTNSDPCIVMAIYSRWLLAFAKPGDQAWTLIDSEYIRPVFDAIYFQGNFYSCNQKGEVFLIEDLDGSHPKPVKFALPPPAPSYTDKYIFDLGGNLCLASRDKNPVYGDHGEEVDDHAGGEDDDEEDEHAAAGEDDDDGDEEDEHAAAGEDDDDGDEEDEHAAAGDEEDENAAGGEDDDDDDGDEDEDEDLHAAAEEEGDIQSFATYKFEIYKLDMLTREWQKIYSLGDSSLFLGNCCSFTIAAADYPGCKPNCIYFTDDDPLYYDINGGSDMGIYDCQNLELESDEAVEFFPKSKDVQHLLPSSLSPPMWVIPYNH